MGYSFTPCSQPVKKRYETMGREVKEDSGENRGKGQCKPGWQSPCISFNNSNAQKRRVGEGGGGEYPHLAKQLANADSDT